MNDFKPQIIAFCCSNCASSAANVAEGMNKTLPANVKIIEVGLDEERGQTAWVKREVND